MAYSINKIKREKNIPIITEKSKFKEVLGVNNV